MGKMKVSFGEEISNQYGKEYLELIWNIKNECSPFDISHKSNKDIIFNCENGHPFTRKPYIYLKTQNCPICKKTANSLATQHPESIIIWSSLNSSTPYDFSSGSSEVVYWKCGNNIHKDYHRNIKSSVAKNFLCPECEEKKHHPNLWNRLQLDGQQFGELFVDSFAGTDEHGTLWNCICSCGANVIKRGNDLTSGKIVTCGDRTIHRTGENNSNWKDGATEKNYSIRYSPEYKQWRENVLENCSYICQCCGADDELQGHHIKDFAQYDTLRLDERNGIALCGDCHDVKKSGSLHNILGCIGVTPQQLEEYINIKRMALGIPIPFSLDSYLQGNILKPRDIVQAKHGKWIFNKYTINELRNEKNITSSGFIKIQPRRQKL